MFLPKTNNRSATSKKNKPPLHGRAECIYLEWDCETPFRQHLTTLFQNKLYLRFTQKRHICYFTPGMLCQQSFPRIAPYHLRYILFQKKSSLVTIRKIPPLKCKMQRTDFGRTRKENLLHGKTLTGFPKTPPEATMSQRGYIRSTLLRGEAAPTRWKISKIRCG
jgi:hypothetical protein